VSSPLARSLAAMNEMLMDFWAGTVTERILARDPMEEIRRAFQLFDDDNTGRISIRNLRRVAKEIGDRLEDDELCVIPLFLWPPPMFSDTAGRQTSDDRRIRPRPGWRDKRARVFRYHDGRGIVLSLDFLYHRPSSCAISVVSTYNIPNESYFPRLISSTESVGAIIL
jgi:hypothetical protein